MAETSSVAVNKAKQWQIALFPFNNAATNVYFAFYTYFTYFAMLYLTAGDSAAAAGITIASAGLVAVISAFTAIFTPLMRVFDGITDPILGGIMDRTHGRFGKFRLYMVLGNIMLALSLIIMMVAFRWLPGIDPTTGNSNPGYWVRWLIYIISYIIYVLGYTCQCAVTKAGQTCLTNDPKQRSQTVIWNMVGQIGSIVLVNVMAGGILTNEAICPKGTIEYVSEAGETIKLTAAAYGYQFYNIMVPFVIIVSLVYTIMALAAIWEKDRPEYWGVNNETPKLKDYWNLIKGNKEIRWLVLSSGLNKLASTIATSAAVAFMLYGCLMGDYNGLYIPLYALCFIFMGLFFVWGSKTAGRKGQKRGVAQFSVLAFLFYIGVVILLAVYSPSNEATHLTLFSMEGGFHITINIYTVLFIIFYGCGYGAFNCCDQLTIPMVADCTDYETYRSGKYVPGIMGTIFSLVDKLISSLQQLLLYVFIVLIVPGLEALPGENTPYMDGMQLATIICFCLLPMLAWAITTFCMTRYSLSGERLKEIQAVNAVRKAAIQGGMSSEEALKMWTTIDQVPAMFVNNANDKETKENILDKIYKKVFTRREKVGAIPSSNPIDIPEQYRTEEVKKLYNTNVDGMQNTFSSIENE